MFSKPAYNQLQLKSLESHLRVGRGGTEEVFICGMTVEAFYRSRMTQVGSRLAGTIDMKREKGCH